MFGGFTARKYVMEMELAASSCVHFVTRTAHIGTCQETACILD